MKINVLLLIFLTFFYSEVYSYSDTIDNSINMVGSLKLPVNNASKDTTSVENDQINKKSKTVGLIICCSVIGTTLGIVLFTLLLNAIENHDGRGIMVDG